MVFIYSKQSFQILLLYCCMMSVVAFLADAYYHDVEFSLEELMEVDEAPLLSRAESGTFSNLLPCLSLLTAVYIVIANYGAHPRTPANNNVWYN